MADEENTQPSAEQGAVADTPAADEGAPAEQADGEAPEPTAEEAQQPAEEAPETAQEEAPKPADDAPEQATEEAPKAEDAPEQATEEAPKADDAPEQATEEAPKADDAPEQATEEAPKADDAPEQATEETPKADEEAPEPAEEPAKEAEPAEEQEPTPVPAEQAAQEETSKPAEEAPEPAAEQAAAEPAEEQTPKPAEEAAETVSEEAPKPAEDAAPETAAEEAVPEPAQEVAPEPAEEQAPKPAEEQAPKPAEEAAETAPEEAPKPAEDAAPETAAEEAAPEPAQEAAPEPAEEQAPKPAEEAAETAPEEASKPAEEAPAGDDEPKEDAKPAEGSGDEQKPEVVAAAEEPAKEAEPAEEPKTEQAPVPAETEKPPTPTAPAAEQPKPSSPEPQTNKVKETEVKASKASAINLEATATVKFVLMPSGQVVTMACMLGQTLRELKIQFANELKMPVNLILLMFDGKSMSDTTTLADLGVGPNGTVQLEMQSADPVNNPIRSYRPRQEYQMPDVITVRVQTDGEAKDVVVEIERATAKKPFLGGFRHKVNGAEFHNAAAQTIMKPRVQSGVERFCRDTQTFHQIHRVQQTFNDTSTQMTGIGVFVSNTQDKLMVPGKYTFADDHLNSILEKVILIQKYYRRWLAQNYVNKLKEDKRKRLEYERQEELHKQKEKEDRIKREFERRMQPKTKEDFDLLYAALEKWRLEELDRINSTLTGAERKAALCMLLDQETQLLAAIERHKLETGTDNKQQRIQDFLDKAAAPKKWRGFDGKPTEMDTPYTLRAKELRDIYNSINMKYLTQDERLDVLLTLKHTVKEHDCKLTQEIIELIDREADLLMRGVKESNLTGLRKRISTLFLQYIKTPTFNPEAAHLLKVPQDPSTLRKNIYFCSSCSKYLPSTEFYLSSNSRNVGKCRSCLKIDNDARVRQDYSHYRRMLKALRRSEETYEDGSQIAFLMQESDLRYLVENIWNGQSVLSAWQDLYDLVLVRWDRHSQWAPWNCILLTQDEAKSHDRLVTLEEGYGDVFIHKVTQKHTLARNYFSRLPGMVELIRQHGADTSKSMAPGPSTISGHALNMQPQKV